VYNRIHPQGSKGSTGLATFATFVVSACWHGVYPGYYFAFVSLSLLTTLSRYCRRHVRPIFLHRGTKVRVLYDIAGWICTQTLVAYMMSAFFVRSLENTINVYGMTNFHGHILILGSLLFFALGGAKFLQLFHAPVPPSEISGDASGEQEQKLVGLSKSEEVEEEVKKDK
jgi:lysophospholipid acyltransferase